MANHAHKVIVHKLPVGTMHHGGWNGVAALGGETEEEVLTELGHEGWELVSVITNPHDTERTFYLRKAI